MLRSSFDFSNKEFILWRQPGDENFLLYLLEADEAGEWVFADFAGQLYRYSSTSFLEIEPIELTEKVNLQLPGYQNRDIETLHNEYIEKVEKAISDIKTGILEKVVLSRRFIVEIKLNPAATLWQMSVVYPQACVFLISTKNTGFWMGATPEQLLRCENFTAKAASLAGTKLNVVHEEWTDKERHEQQVVTDGVMDVFKTFGLDDVVVSHPETIVAGPVKHLFSTISGRMQTNHLAINLAKMLHPTPALGGYPLKKAVEYIYGNERYDRGFYSGYFGFADGQDCSLWVNLRSMQIFGNRVVLYAGGGITAASNPEKEWEETERKLQTLLRVIHPQE